MKGMVVFDYADRYEVAARKIAGWIAEGRIVAREQVVEGDIEAFPDALLMRFRGRTSVPKAIRDQIGLEPGHDVDVELVGDEIRIRRARPLKASEFLGVWGPPEGMDGWAEEKRREIEIEERKWKQ